MDLMARTALTTGDGYAYSLALHAGDISYSTGYEVRVIECMHAPGGCRRGGTLSRRVCRMLTRFCRIPSFHLLLRAEQVAP